MIASKTPPARIRQAYERPRRIDRTTTGTEWACSIVPNPPGQLLLVECRGGRPATGVRVFLDGVPAEEDPTVYVSPQVPEIVAPGTELEYLFAPAGDRPRFRTIEVRWTDVDGRPMEFATGV